MPQYLTSPLWQYLHQSGILVKLQYFNPAGNESLARASPASCEPPSMITGTTPLRGFFEIRAKGPPI